MMGLSSTSDGTGDGADAGDGGSGSDSTGATNSGSAGTDAGSDTGADTGSDTNNSGFGETGGLGDGDGDNTATGITTQGDGATGDGDWGGDGDGDGWTSTDDGECLTAGAGDGDGDGDGTPPDPACEAPMQYRVCDATSDDPFHAMGLNCSTDPTETIVLINPEFHATDPLSWTTARSYGDALSCAGEAMWVPREGEKFLIVSTGELAPPDANGNVSLAFASTQPGADAQTNPDDVSALPGPMTASPGSNNGAGGTPFMDCDGVGDCSDTLEGQWTLGEARANDLLWFEFEVDVPQGVNGYRFDFAWFSSEYPEWVGDIYNDMVVVWASGQSYTGNIAFIDQQPLTVTALEPHIAHGPSSQRLSGTGFETVGGATGWFEARGSAVPGERLRIGFALYDMGDTVYDTTMILDAFRWECEGCMAQDPEDCGVQGPS
jgi:hypothetical protein